MRMELDVALKSVGIQLTQVDLHDVLSAMDKNGNLLLASLGCNKAGDELSWRNELWEEWAGKKLLLHSLRSLNARLVAQWSPFMKSIKYHTRM